jgi:hypothetical protein
LVCANAALVEASANASAEIRMNLLLMWVLLGRVAPQRPKAPESAAENQRARRSPLEFVADAARIERQNRGV